MSSLSLLNLQLKRNHHDLDRLEICKKRLIEIRKELAEREHLCIEPPLSEKTWKGHLAKQFEAIRKNDLLESYQHHKQKLNHSIQLINNQMSHLVSDNLHLEKAVHAEVIKIRKKD